MIEFDRRKFLRTSVLGGAGAVLATTALVGSSAIAGRVEVGNLPPIKRKLGRTGIELPIVSFGVMRADSPALIQEALKAGIVLFDTAHSYQRGKNEEMLGNALKDYPRNSFILATKIEAESYDKRTGAFGPGVTSKAFLDRLDVSLNRLKMDYVDILYVHNIMTRDTALFPAMLEAVTTAKKSGKAKYIGVSTHKNQAEVIQAAIDSGVYEVVLTALNYKQDNYEELKNTIAKAAMAGLGIVAMKTMAGGFHDKDRVKPINCKAALKFVLQDENITTSIPGIANLDHLAMNASVNHDITLTKEEEADLLIDKSQGGLYCQGCEHCIPKCPKGLPLPEIMRAYMYTYGYNNFEQAYTLLADLDLPVTPCKECSSCSVECSRGFDVSERVTDVMRLLQVPQEFIG